MFSEECIQKLSYLKPTDRCAQKRILIQVFYLENFAALDKESVVFAEISLRQESWSLGSASLLKDIFLG